MVPPHVLSPSNRVAAFINRITSHPTGKQQLLGSLLVLSSNPNFNTPQATRQSARQQRCPDHRDLDKERPTVS